MSAGRPRREAAQGCAASAGADVRIQQPVARAVTQGRPGAGAGVKVLLAGEQQAAVTVAVEALMDGKPSPELDSFATFDPKARRPMPAFALTMPAGRGMTPVLAALPPSP